MPSDDRGAPEYSRQSTYLHYILGVTADIQKRIYGVLDGAFFDNALQHLVAADLNARPLYLPTEDMASSANGPWLISPYRDCTYTMRSELARRRNITNEDAGGGSSFLRPILEDWASVQSGEPSTEQLRNGQAIRGRMEALLALIGDKPALVFWIGDAALTEDKLYRHLRGLNQILVPRSPAESDGASSTLPNVANPNAMPSYGATHEPVVFRHADANVMTQVLPALDNVQTARLFGPCEQILFAPQKEWGGGGVKRFTRPRRLPEAPSGPLRLEQSSINAIEAQRLEGSRQKVATYLREVDPITETMSEAELHKRIVHYEKTGNELGIESERAHMKWAYLMSITGGEISQAKETKQYFKTSPKHPDNAIDDLLDELDKSMGGNWNKIWLGSQK